jgi:hypothetical protein
LKNKTKEVRTKYQLEDHTFNTALVKVMQSLVIEMRIVQKGLTNERKKRTRRAFIKEARATMAIVTNGKPEQNKNIPCWEYNQRSNTCHPKIHAFPHK